MSFNAAREAGTRLPTGTVTFLFTDIEGSTSLVRQLGHRYPDVLEIHRRLLRETIDNAKGYEFETQGDAFFVLLERQRRDSGSNRRATGATPPPLA